MNDLIGKDIYLTHQSVYGRKTIFENGHAWTIIDFKRNVLACQQKDAYCIESKMTKAWRWIAVKDDRDFFWNVIS